MKRILIIVCLFAFVQLQAQDAKKDEAGAPVSTKGSVLIGGKTINYSAQTGYMPMKNAEGKHIANVFYTSYIKDGETSVKNRPITFVFNGGPGSASVWLHMGALGPKRIKTNSDGNALPTPYAYVNNDYSWLDVTDLVFIDPVGTGFSQPANEEKPDQFYGYKNDIQSVSEFIRLWVVQNQRWGSPKYLAGESYGTTRACGVAEYLQDEFKMYINGISLISCALDFQTLRENQYNDLPMIINLPVYALTAQYHKKLSESLNVDTSLATKVEKFAFEVYSVALLKGDLLSEKEKNSIAEQLSAYTGISKEVYLKYNLRLPSWAFRTELLRETNQLVGRYDSRMVMPNPDVVSSYAVEDPSYTQISGAFATGFNEYVQKDLKYTNEEPFQLIGSVSPWKFGDGKYLNVVDQLRNSMFCNPYLKVWVLNGTYDLATSYFGTEYAFNHMDAPVELKKNITFSYFNSGHMMYLLESELAKMKAGAVDFYAK